MARGGGMGGMFGRRTPAGAAAAGEGDGARRTAEQDKDVPPGAAWYGLAWALRIIVGVALIVGVVQAGLRAQHALDLPNTRSGTFDIGGNSGVPYSDALPAFGLVVCPLASSGYVQVDLIGQNSPTTVSDWLKNVADKRALERGSAGRRALAAASPPPALSPPPTPGPVSTEMVDYFTETSAGSPNPQSGKLKKPQLGQLATLYGDSCTALAQNTFANEPNCVEVGLTVRVFAPRLFLQPTVFTASDSTYHNGGPAFLNLFAALSRPVLNISGPAAGTGSAAAPGQLGYMTPAGAPTPNTSLSTPPIPVPTGACTIAAINSCPLVYYEVELVAHVTPAVAVTIDPDFPDNGATVAALYSVVSQLSLGQLGLCNTTATLPCPSQLLLSNYSILTQKPSTMVHSSTSSEFSLGLPPAPGSPPAGVSSSSDVAAASQLASANSLSPVISGYVTLTNAVAIASEYVQAAIQMTICASLGCPLLDGDGPIRPAMYGERNGLRSTVDVTNYLGYYVNVNATLMPGVAACTSATQFQYAVTIQAKLHLKNFTVLQIEAALADITQASAVTVLYAYAIAIRNMALRGGAALNLGSCAQQTAVPAAGYFTSTLSAAGAADSLTVPSNGLFGFIGDVSGCTFVTIPSSNRIFAPSFASQFFDPSTPLPSDPANSTSPLVLKVTASVGSTVVVGLYPLAEGLAGANRFMTVRTDAAGLVLFPQISASLSLKLKKVDGSNMEQAKAFYSNLFSSSSLYDADWQLSITEANSIGSAYTVPPAQVGRPASVKFLIDLQPYFISWTVPYTAEVFGYGVADAIVASLTYFNTVLLLLGLFVPTLLVHWHRKSRDMLHATLMSDQEAAKAAFDSTLYNARELALRNKLVDLEANIARVEGLFENKSDAWLHQAEMRRLLGMQPQPPKAPPAPKEEAFATPAKGGRTPAGGVQLTSPPPGATVWKCALPSCSEANKKMYVECPKCGTKYCCEKHRQEHWTKGHAATCRLGMKR